MMVANYGCVRARVYVEFRERGIVCGACYWPWESIRACDWSDEGFTLRLKWRHGITKYQLRPQDKEAVQRVLDEHLTEHTVTG